ncbi:MAG TPA: GTP-binding protein [bacterium]|nr:GTP-binding protein [bacterium]HPS30655.1 GTP-binding protein [bacterium]
MNCEKFPLVFAGHVDHGKSTIIGRLLIETGNLPDGKLEAIKNYCKINSRPFEYAFLIDALKDEQSQGITIDTARVFFSTGTRDFVIIDAPGHIEFLKNMVTGASRAEAAFLVIAADEGVQENSRRHGYMLSILGIRQIVVLVNKMDLVGYSIDCFNKIREEFGSFLKEIGIAPMGFVPVSGIEGTNIRNNSESTPWYNGKTVYEFLESFENKKSEKDLPFRMFVQDIYRFTEMNDHRRIYAGTVNSGTISKGDTISFYPSGEKSRISSIESFNTPEIVSATAGNAIGVTLEKQIYTTRGELMVKEGEPLPQISKHFKAAVFWLGNEPLKCNEEYFIKIGTARTTLKLLQIIKLIDTSTLSNKHGDSVGKHEAAECLFETGKPVAFDPIHLNQETGRFVIVSKYEIRGGGIILEKITFENNVYEKGAVSANERELRYGQKPLLILLKENSQSTSGFAEKLERYLFENGKFVYKSEEINLEDTITIKHLLNTGIIVIATVNKINPGSLKILREKLNPVCVTVIEPPEFENVPERMINFLKKEGVFSANTYG